MSIKFNLKTQKIFLGNKEVIKVYKGTTLLYEKVLAPQGETWIINENPVLTFQGNLISFYVNFTSNNTEYVKLGAVETSSIIDFFYYKTIYPPTSDIAYSGYGGTWINQAYRTITFDEAPTGNLLTWLQANAVKQ